MSLQEDSRGPAPGAVTRPAGEHSVLCLVAADGHVPVLPAVPVPGLTVHAHQRLLQAAELPGWQLHILSPADAVAAYIGGLGCRRCRTVTRCRCSAAAVLAGRCPHGTAATALATGEPRPAQEGQPRHRVPRPQIGPP